MIYLQASDRDERAVQLRDMLANEYGLGAVNEGNVKLNEDDYGLRICIDSEKNDILRSSFKESAQKNTFLIIMDPTAERTETETNDVGAVIMRIPSVRFASQPVISKTFAHSLVERIKGEQLFQPFHRILKEDRTLLSIRKR